MVKVVPMKLQHVLFWHAHVQPMINQLYKTAASGDRDENIRADVGWDWRTNFVLMKLHNSASHFPGNASGAAHGLAVVVEAKSGEEVPVGMLNVVPRFDTTVQGTRRARTFAWYLSDAPAEFYDALKVLPLRLMAKALLDTALQAGWSEQMDGEFLLHADPAGGEKLRRFYSNKCKMRPLQPATTPISPLRRRSAEGYFHFTAAESKAFSVQFDSFR
jgi:hypothetical protein